ncbi:DUF5642 family protein [Mycolicibacterium aubagnense]|uniref:DUF5642 domain-containing protein n=1 Tax=Mycolicibacterium aubagnense TaxID=319707 RepID=A0ABM7I9X5_9MYCO|nr:DUF5642 family protein [Mycolicibacterium aubagnense]BBX83742.1 hypothetical protein MAUB_16150 [Mycolicibacterium aubagnense]
MGSRSARSSSHFTDGGGRGRWRVLAPRHLVRSRYRPLPRSADRSEAPAGYESRSGQRVINQVTVDSFKTPKPGEVRPASCAKQQTEGILGETVYGVNAYGKGLFYVISAQQLPSGGGPHQDSAVDCSYMSVTFPDGYAITTPADVPQIAGLKVEATHTVSKRGGRVIDNYYYKTWLDGFHAVTLIVNSDPSVTPSSSPIDPALAKEIFTESVALVRGH